MPELPVQRPKIEVGQKDKGIRDLAVAALGVVMVALVTWVLDNAGLIGDGLDISPDTVVTVVTAVASLFGWRSIRK